MVVTSVMCHVQWCTIVLSLNLSRGCCRDSMKNLTNLRWPRRQRDEEECYFSRWYLFVYSGSQWCSRVRYCTTSRCPHWVAKCSSGVTFSLSILCDGLQLATLCNLHDVQMSSLDSSMKDCSSNSTYSSPTQILNRCCNVGITVQLSDEVFNYLKMSLQSGIVDGNFTTNASNSGYIIEWIRSNLLSSFTRY